MHPMSIHLPFALVSLLCGCFGWPQTSIRTSDGRRETKSDAVGHPNCKTTLRLIRDEEEGHQGADFAICEGEEVVAIADGVTLSVVRGEGDAYRGDTILVKHRLISGITVLVSYTHLSNVALARGTILRRGQKLGGPWRPLSAMPGQWKEHVHIEILDKSSNVRISSLLKGCVSAVSEGFVYPVSC